MNSVAEALNFHSQIFGHGSTDSWKEIYPAWSQLFLAEGVSGTTLQQAVQAVFKRTVQPRWPSEHLQALREEIHAVRSCESARREIAITNAAVCRYCRDTGFVLDLPHLCQIEDNEWTHLTRGFAPYFTSVICDQCLIGRSKPREIPDNRRLATLTEYQLRNPNWRQQVRKYLDRRRAKSDAWAASTIHDSEDPKMINRKMIAKRLIERLGLPAKEDDGNGKEIVSGSAPDGE